MKSKKALSPLIAAVLLIVIVVGIGAVVMGIVRGFVTENKETMEKKSDALSCSRDVNIDLVTIDGIAQICKDSNYIYAIVENVGATEVDDFQLVVMATSGFYSNDSISVSITEGSAGELNGTFVGVSQADILQAKFVPKLRESRGSGYHYCSEVSVMYEGLQDCPLD
ncbi:hypothetical protein KY362_00090 [Candidatus Woesearchaeota archaeon]|nr:hypothetical protein [Candidatus Woesearchaeota archaeon]